MPRKLSSLGVLALDMEVAEDPPSKKARWADRLVMARSMISSVASNVRPVSSRLAGAARRGGEVAGGAIQTGSLFTGALVAGAGAMSFGGLAGAALVAGGGMLAAGGVAGGWIVKKVGDGTAHGIALSGAITETSLTVSDQVMSAVTALLTKSQTELLLGDEGAAVLQLIVTQLRFECQSVPGLDQVSYQQLVQGILAWCCLQRVQRVGYGAKGFLIRRVQHQQPLHDGGDAESSGGGSCCSDWIWEDEPLKDGGRDTLQALRRSLHMACLSYSVMLDVLVGQRGGETDAGGAGLLLENSSQVLRGRRNEALVSALGLHSLDDILAAQWDTEGPHAPGYLLLADRHGGNGKGDLVVVIRGTMTTGDALTDLRCDAARLSSNLSPGVAGEPVHRGMWESAVRLDGKLRHLIEEALAPGSPHEGWRLRVVGHSLGAGVAALLTLRWREMVPLFRQHDVRCHAFGVPCVLGESAAAATASYITSMILADDAVCRWSVRSTLDVLQAAVILSSEPGATSRLVRLAVGAMASPDRVSSPRPSPEGACKPF